MITGIPLYYSMNRTVNMKIYIPVYKLKYDTCISQMFGISLYIHITISWRSERVMKTSEMLID